MNNTTDTETLAALYYEMASQVAGAALQFQEKHPDDPKEQVREMLYLFTSVMAAFIDCVPGLKEDHTIELAKKAYLHARTALADKPETGSLN